MDNNKKWKTVGIGVVAVTATAVSSFLIRKFVRQRKITKFFDSITENDIAWG